MKLKNRFLLIGLGLIIFLLVTPLLILFARGFKYDFEHGHLVKTGTLVVETQPSRAQVIIDGKLQKSLTPESFRFLMPQDYTITIKKDNYQDWTKRLSVKPQLVTWTNLNRDFIALFYKQPKFINTITSSVASLSSDKKELVFIESEKIGALNLEKDRKELLGDATNLDVTLDFPLAWTNGKKIYGFFKDFSASNLNLKTNQITSATTNGTHTLIQVNNSLYHLIGATPHLLSNVKSYILDGDYAWYIRNNELIKQDLFTSKTEVIRKDIPAHNNSQIIMAEGQIFLILDGSLYKISEKIEKVYGNATTASWDKKSQQLLIANQNEILLLDSGSLNPVLVLRSLSLISSPQLNFVAGYIFFQNEGKIKAIEIDGRDHRNIYTVAEALDQFAVSESGNMLYVFNKEEINAYEIR